MGKRNDISKILVIGSGPIVIGQAAEFDYSGTQACLALKEEGYQVILINSNPATIMTDTAIADKVYMEPLTLEYVARIIRLERPQAIIASLGGQTALNIAMKLAQKGVLEECQCELLGTAITSIELAENRQYFKKLCESIGQPVLESNEANTVEAALEVAQRLGYPLIIRPAFTLGGTGGGFVNDDQECCALVENALKLSPSSQVLVERSIKGYKEVEFEVMRDKNDTAIVICCLENIDPVGIHTGDSMVVAPCQTLTLKEYQLLKEASLSIIRALKIEGGCNIQFALDPFSFDYYVIEVNPRVSRSSALASKASGYPIAKVSAKIAVGYSLAEISLDNLPACTEPVLDYVVTKLARFPFDKFVKADRRLSTQMKATGEVMGIGRTMEESLLKAVRCLEIGAIHIELAELTAYSQRELLDLLSQQTDTRLFVIAELFRRQADLDLIYRLTKIDAFFLEKIRNIITMEENLKNSKWSRQLIIKAKRLGFSDYIIARLLKTGEKSIRDKRKKEGIVPVYKMIDCCAGVIERNIPYYYSSYEQENESLVSEQPSIIVLGSGPIRIGQGVEFDYSTTQAIWAIKEAGYQAIVINNNPETVSTDYSVSDKLYFEPLTIEDVMNVIDLEQPLGVMVAFGGQTAINLAEQLQQYGVPILGTTVAAIKKAENRDDFEKLVKKLGIPQPPGQAVFDLSAGLRVANRIGYPVLVRPSYVLGGRAMNIVNNDEELSDYLSTAVALDRQQPVLVDKYLPGKEVEVDAICDGSAVFIPGIMQLVEEAGVHSGDSMSIYPPYSLSEAVITTIADYTMRLGREIGIIGLFNVQYIITEADQVYVIEVNPRSSRSVPFLSKATQLPLSNIATKVMLGSKLADLGYKDGLLENRRRYYVKSPTFSFEKIHGLDTYLSPEMKSTGEAIGYDDNLNRALFKALQASYMRVENYGTVFVTIAEKDKLRALPYVERFYRLGFNIEATLGTAEILKKHNIKTRVKKKLSEGSSEILDSIRHGHITYIINTITPTMASAKQDGYYIRRCAVENNVPVFTSLDTVKVLLDVLEEMTVGVSPIDQQ